MTRRVFLRTLFAGAAAVVAAPLLDRPSLSQRVDETLLRNAERSLRDGVRRFHASYGVRERIAESPRPLPPHTAEQLMNYPVNPAWEKATYHVISLRCRTSFTFPRGAGSA